MTLSSTFFASPFLVFSSAFLLRAILLLYGIHQDSVSALKYTDIDYYVFTDAARAVARNSSPYDRATYRYTPLLAWILLPTARDGNWWHFGKAIFAASDLLAGWLILVVLRRKGLSQTRALKYASVWLLNPMVANISTRGSSEGLLCVLVMALLWSFESHHVGLAGSLLGLSVHFKIYPFIYGTSMLLALESKPRLPPSATLFTRLSHFLNRSRIKLLSTSLVIFTALNLLMYTIYGPPFLQHTFLHHLNRIDHRHNFSPYNTLLYLSSAGLTNNTLSFESLAFVPQLLLSALLIPLSTSRMSLPGTMLAQTVAFVTFNKVCTSQYFLWYLIFLPVYLPDSSLIRKPMLGLTALALWVLGQAAWLQQGYELEFLGRSTFAPGLWIAALGFFGVNCWILVVILQDILARSKMVRHTNNDIVAADLKTAERNTVEMKHEKFPDFPNSSTQNSSTTSASASAIAAMKRDRKSSVSGTTIGTTHLGPRGRVLRSSPGLAGTGPGFVSSTPR